MVSLIYKREDHIYKAEGGGVSEIVGGGGECEWEEGERAEKGVDGRGRGGDRRAGEGVEWVWIGDVGAREVGGWRDFKGS